MMLVVGAIWAAGAVAYTGPFCYRAYIRTGHYCVSSLVNNIRRAVGNSDRSYTKVDVAQTYGESTGYCYNYYGCTADTGYIYRDGRGNGYIYSEGPRSGDHYYGYLYA